MWCVSSVPKPESRIFFLSALPSRFVSLKVDEFRAVGDIRPAVARLNAGGDEQPIREYGRLVGLAVVVAVLEHDDLVVRLLARLDLRIDLARRDPEPALRIEVHLDRFGQQRIGRVQVHLEPRRDDERLAFQFRIGVRHLGVTLGGGGARDESEQQGE